MAEVSAAELRRLRQLEDRIASTQDTLGEVRAKRDEARAEAQALRAQNRTLTRDTSKMNKQIQDLIEENARLATAGNAQIADLQLVTTRAEELSVENTKLTAELGDQSTALAAAVASLATTVKERELLSKQLVVANEQLDGGEAAEVNPEQLSELLSSFVSSVGKSTGLENVGTKLNLKVGFSGRGGGSFVVPSVGSDPDRFPELHELSIDLAPATRFDEGLTA